MKAHLVKLSWLSESIRRIATEYFFAEPTLASVFEGLRVSDGAIFWINNSLKSKCFTFLGDKEGYLWREEGTAIVGGGSGCRPPQILLLLNFFFDFCSIAMWKKSTLSTLLKLNVTWFYWKSTFIHETNILLDFWTFFNIMCFPFLATLGFTRVVWDQPFCRWPAQSYSCCSGSLLELAIPSEKVSPYIAQIHFHQEYIAQISFTILGNVNFHCSALLTCGKNW